MCFGKCLDYLGNICCSDVNPLRQKDIFLDEEEKGKEKLSNNRKADPAKTAWEVCGWDVDQTRTIIDTVLALGGNAALAQVLVMGFTSIDRINALINGKFLYFAGLFPIEAISTAWNAGNIALDIYELGRCCKCDMKQPKKKLIKDIIKRSLTCIGSGAATWATGYSMFSGGTPTWDANARLFMVTGLALLLNTITFGADWTCVRNELITVFPSLKCCFKSKENDKKFADAWQNLKAAVGVVTAVSLMAGLGLVIVALEGPSNMKDSFLQAATYCFSVTFGGALGNFALTGAEVLSGKKALLKKDVLSDRGCTFFKCCGITGEIGCGIKGKKQPKKFSKVSKNEMEQKLLTGDEKKPLLKNKEIIEIKKNREGGSDKFTPTGFSDVKIF